MIYTALNIDLETKKKIKVLSKKYDIPIYKLVSTIVLFFYENKEIVNADFFQKSEKEKDEKLNEKLVRGVEKIVKKEINRLIGFIKVQDKFMKNMKTDILYELKENDSDEYNPLFQDYEYIIQILKEILTTYSVRNEDEIYTEIKLKLGVDTLEYYKESETKIVTKKILIN